MRGAEGWGFLALMGSLVGVALSLSVLSGSGQVAGLLASVALGVLSGGLYAVAGGQQRQRPAAAADPADAPDR